MLSWVSTCPMTAGEDGLNLWICKIFTVFSSFFINTNTLGPK